VKPVPDMTYNVFSGTLYTTQSISNVMQYKGSFSMPGKRK